MSKIKICGLRRYEDIEAVNRCMPDYAGFILAPNRKRTVSLEQAAALKKRLSREISAVGVFVDGRTDAIAKLLERGVIDMAQLHGQESEEEVRRLKELTGKPVIKAVSVKTPKDIERWRHSAADFLLLDNGAGGSGQTFDWSLIPDITDGLPPVFLAGGINISNLEAALALKPYAVDISGGVEAGGYKDEGLIREAINKVRRFGNDER
ncbi:MAG: phosphoribosylanthranilate isomerase [Butyrivibrio sp.]|nr:phosphoribosylanthranilate isomerase [Butyrivibrio sp.]